MPRSCKCILDRAVFKGAMSEEDRDKIMRNLKSDDKVIVVQLDCLMAKDRLAAFRKSLLAQMEEGLVVIPPWAHVAYVGNECEIEIKELKREEDKTKNDKIAKQILADLAGMSVNDDLRAISNKLIFGGSSVPLPYEERKTGKWVLVDMGDMDLYKCSLCKTRSMYKSPFCPHCGAKMEGEK